MTKDLENKSSLCNPDFFIFIFDSYGLVPCFREHRTRLSSSLEFPRVWKEEETLCRLVGHHGSDGLVTCEFYTDQAASRSLKNTDSADFFFLSGSLCCQVTA